MLADYGIQRRIKLQAPNLRFAKQNWHFSFHFAAIVYRFVSK